jgi:hypothetical protein
VAEVRRVPRWRRILVGFLVVLACLLAVVSVLAVWVGGTLLDTDQWVSTVGPLASKPSIQQGVANRVTNALTEKVDVQGKVEDALPSRADFLAPYLATGLKGFVHTATLKFAESSQFQTVWDGLNRRAHTQVVAVLQGKGTDTVATKDGKVVVHLGPVLSKIDQRLQKRGIDLFASVSNKDPTIVLMDSKDLRSVQGAVDLLNSLSVALPIVTVLLFAVAIWLSPRRRRTILRCGLGIALGMALLLIIFSLLRDAYLDALGPNVNRGAAGDVYDQLLTFLRTSVRTLFAVGVVVALGAWLAGPGRVATRIREGVRGATPEGEPSGVTVFAARYKNPLRVTIVGIGLLLLIVLSHPGPVAVLVVAIVVVLALLLIEFLASRAPAVPDVATGSN